MPPWAKIVAVLVVVLEAVGLAVRLGGAEQRWAVLSMDAPGSLARSTVVGTFAVVTAVAVLGAVRHPGRRTWWSAVAGVTALVAVVKAGGDVHARAMAAVDGYAHPVRGLVLSGLAGGAVLLGLFVLSGGDRRDRRRVLLWLGVYAVVAGGLSIGSAVAGQWSATAGSWATWVEETGEAVAAVGVLLSVVLGVLPRLVLPADWVLRRPEDVLAQDAPVVLGTAVSG